MVQSRSIALIFLVGFVLFAGCAGLSEPGADAVETTPAITSTPQSDETFESPNGTTEVHNINVGQSVSTLFIGPTGETMLVDTGDYDDDGEHVLQYLQRHDIDRIDYLVVSHNDADHIGGNAAVIDYYETEANGIGAIYDPGIAASTNTYDEYLDAVEEHDVTLYETREGDSIPFEGVNVSVLGPPDPYIANEARNENSIVLHLEYGETSFLWTGDAEADQEAYLVEEYGSKLDATIYKAGHHGSSSSSSGALLDAAQPEATVISSAYDSQYGHPHDEVLQRLADRSIPTYWTATHGDTVLVTNRQGISVRTQQAATTDPLSIRNEEPVAVGTTDPVVERTQIGAGPDVTSTSAPPVTATDGGTETSSDGDLVIEAIHADAAGDDRENLNDEYVVFRNDGDASLELTGWTVQDEAEKTYRFPDGFSLEPGARVTLYTGSGTDTDSELYWGMAQPVWNNNGDTVIVTNADGEQVLMEAYS